MKKKVYPILAIRLSKAERQRIDQAAKARGQSRGAFIRSCVAAVLAEPGPGAAHADP